MVVRTAATQVTISIISFTLNPQLIVGLDRYATGNVYQETLTPKTNAMTYDSVTGVLTVALMNSAVGDTFC